MDSGPLLRVYLPFKYFFLRRTFWQRELSIKLHFTHITYGKQIFFNDNFGCLLSLFEHFEPIFCVRYFGLLHGIYVPFTENLHAGNHYNRDHVTIIVTWRDDFTSS